MNTDQKDEITIGSATGAWEKSGPQPGYYKLPRKEVFGYSLVDLAMNLAFQAIMMYITFFYTDVFGLRPGHVAVMFLVARLWDTINDPIMGWVVERLNPRHGKYKSWILYGSLPFAIAAVLTYTTPEMTYGAKLVWAYATYNILNMGYTLIIQPYISLASVMTADPSERTRLQSMRMMFAQAGGVIVALTIPLLSDFLNQYFSLQQSYMFTVALMSVVMLAILLYAYTQVTERIKVTSHEDPPGFKEIIRQATNNKYVVLMFLLFFGVYGFNTIVGSSSVYYISYYADRPDMMAWFSLMVVLPSVFGVPIVPWLIRRFKKKGAVIIGLVVGALGAILLAMLPPSALALMLVFRGISSFGYGILMGSLWAIIIDPVEYGDLNTGRRLTAIVMTLIGLGLKASMLLGGVVPAWILEAVNYVPDVAQSQEALNGIHFMSTWLPAIILIITLLIFVLFYDLSEEKVADIQHKIAVRDGLVEPVTDEEHVLVAEAAERKSLRDAERAKKATPPVLGTTSAAPSIVDPTRLDDPKED
ncbi:MFS transporter [Flaviflexus ciconiae]|uniref:MFS transporter n=1 Tax=Flaviflexus ciconiae TaxID=2496867 RepID=A0A3S9Q003_9ACTO|nr:glycoside-pentoside-hexuronide (GPH):cation symporter [Flaviflexus ciconiae]AZQ77914.1 MFS transporter [Flaviflexus ciconiae]